MSPLESVLRLPARLAVGFLVGLVRIYQWTFGPIITLFCGRVCRFEPTCSHYMIGSLRKYGPIRGLIRGLARILRCHPWHPGGYDPP
jgi:putative membrane protein insertion efficiency factor